MGRKFLDLDAVKLIHVAQDVELRHVERTGAILLVQHTQNVQFQFAQFPIGDDQKVAAAAGWVQEFELGEALMELCQFPGWPFKRSNSARSSSKNSGLISLRMFFSVV